MNLPLCLGTIFLRTLSFLGWKRFLWHRDVNNFRVSELDLYDPKLCPCVPKSKLKPKLAKARSTSSNKNRCHLWRLILRRWILGGVGKKQKLCWNTKSQADLGSLPQLSRSLQGDSYQSSPVPTTHHFPSSHPSSSHHPGLTCTFWVQFFPVHCPSGYQAPNP